MDQPDPPTTGSFGRDDGGHRPNEWLWRDSKDFLDHISKYKARAETEALRLMNNQNEGLRYRSDVVDVLEPSIDSEQPDMEAVGLPSILLTHVPLYRKPGTPCGPLREHYPPSSSSRKGDDELSEDGPNSIDISSGYQYQNVLTPTISNELFSKLEPNNLVHVYSGDDHDYCEIAHREFSGSPKEITVKSISWAMGVRRPGFLLTSLWNPIDLTTAKSTTTGVPTTLQNRLCLLPDQLAIFIRYVQLLFFSLVVLLVTSMVVVFANSENSSKSTILPLNHSTTALSRTTPTKTQFSSSSTSTISPPQGLARRGSNSASYGMRELNITNLNGYGNGYDSRDDKWKRSRPKPNFKGLMHLIVQDFRQRVGHVAVVAFCWYFYLVWKW